MAIQLLYNIWLNESTIGQVFCEWPGPDVTIEGEVRYTLAVTRTADSRFKVTADSRFKVTDWNSLELRAARFAEKAHGEQRRKYTGEPYIIHPQEVASIVRKVTGHTEEMLAAAWLHDTVEDCGVSFTEIENLFGSKVCELIRGLTDTSKPSDGNREVRKAIDRAHTASTSPECKTVKLADLISNTRSIVRHDPKFARVYLAEKRLLLEVLREGDPGLWTEASNLAKGE